MLRTTDNSKVYRHDENIIEASEPTAYRQIVVPGAEEREYVTDDGLVIPSISLDLHRLLFGAADRLGISWERRVNSVYFLQIKLYKFFVKNA